MRAFAKYGLAVWRDGFAALVHIMDRDRHGLHQTLVGEGKFTGGRAFQRHGDGIGKRLHEGVLGGIDIGHRADQAVAAGNGRHSVLRDGVSQVIHIMQHDADGLDDAAILKGYFRGEYTIRVHHHIHRFGADQFVVFGRNAARGQHHAAARGDSLHRILCDGLAVFIHVMHGDVHGMQLLLIHEGNFIRLRAVFVHRHRLLRLADEGVAGNRDGKSAVDAFGKGCRVVSTEGFAILIHIMDDHGDGLHLAFIHEGDFRRIRAVPVHKHDLRGGLPHGIPFHWQREHGVLAGIEAEIGAFHQRIAIRVHIVDLHGSGDFLHRVAEFHHSGVHADAIRKRFLRAKADQFIFIGNDGHGINGVGAGLYRLRGIRRDGLACFVQVAHRHLQRQEGSFRGLFYRRNFGGLFHRNLRGLLCRNFRGLFHRQLRCRRFLAGNVEEADARGIAHGVKKGNGNRRGFQADARVADIFQHAAAFGQKADIFIQPVLNQKRHSAGKKDIQRHGQPQPVFVGRIAQRHGRAVICLLAQRCDRADRNGQPCRGRQRGCFSLRRERGSQHHQSQDECEYTEFRFHKYDASFGIHRSNDSTGIVSIVL